MSRQEFCWRGCPGEVEVLLEAEGVLRRIATVLPSEDWGTPSVVTRWSSLSFRFEGMNSHSR
jgi:hypothetical protein